MRVILANAFSVNMLSDSWVAAEFEKVDIETVKKVLRDGFDSAIGHEATAAFLSKVLGFEVKANRKEVKVDENTVLIIAQVKQRLPEGKVLTEEELKNVPVEFWVVLFMKLKEEYVDILDKYINILEK